MTDNEILRELLDGALRSLESVAKMAGELTSGNVAHAAPAIKGRRCAGWSISKRCYMKTNSDNFFVSPRNFPPKNFGVSQRTTIFATSNLKRGMNAAGYYPAVFVPTLYWNHRITMPCRESGNRPGVLAIMYSTARSMVTFLCQNIIVMQIRKESGSVQPSGDVLHGRVLRQPSRRSGAIRGKKSPKNFGVSQKHVIFATSNQNSGHDAAGYPPAVFVPTLYWNHRITMPCRVSGNRPGVSAILNLTARSMVTFFMSNQNSMQIRKENVPAFTLLTWREIFCHFLRKWQEWKSSENVWFTAWCGERVTNGECAATAIVVCLVFPAMLCLLGLVLEGGAV